MKMTEMKWTGEPEKYTPQSDRLESNRKDKMCLLPLVLSLMIMGLSSIQILADETTSQEPIHLALEDATSKSEQSTLTDWEEKEIVEKTLSVLRDFWKQKLGEKIDGLPERMTNLDIKNIRISYIRDNPLEDGSEDDRKYLKSIYCIVDYLFYCDYYGDSYLSYPGINNSVIVYRDGSMEVSKNVMEYPTMRSHYAYDIIDHISDTGVKYIKSISTNINEPQQNKDAPMNARDQKLIEDTMPILQEGWKMELEKPIGVKRANDIDIKNARIVYIKENPTVEEEGTEDAIEKLKKIDCIVEYLFFCDYFGNSYPIFPSMGNTVAVYRDGSMEMLRTNLLRQIKLHYLIMDYSGVIDHISDTGVEYLP